MLKTHIDGWSLAMVGSWNRAIFTPAWMGGGRLTNLAEIGIEFPLDNPSLPLRYTFDEMILSIGRQKIELKPARPDDVVLERIRKTALRILEDLPHTPIRGVGHNFHFIVDPPEGPLVDLLELSDTDALSDAGFNIQSTSITRSLTINDQIVNLTTSFLDDKKLQIAFNFHSNANSTVQAKEFLESNKIDFRQTAYEILEKIYQVKPELESEVSPA